MYIRISFYYIYCRDLYPFHYSTNRCAMADFFDMIEPNTSPIKFANKSNDQSFANVAEVMENGASSQQQASHLGENARFQQSGTFVFSSEDMALLCETINQSAAQPQALPVSNQALPVSNQALLVSNQPQPQAALVPLPEPQAISAPPPPNDDVSVDIEIAVIDHSFGDRMPRELAKDESSLRNLQRFSELHVRIFLFLFHLFSPYYYTHILYHSKKIIYFLAVKTPKNLSDL